MGGINDVLALPAGRASVKVANRTHLSLVADLSLTDWARVGAELVSLSEASAWWIGDWLVFGQEQYGDRYRRAMAETSLHYQTLRNYAWVARRFEPSRRRERLTFQHHVEVAALSDEEQDHWLDLAMRLGWSRNELRKQIRDSIRAEDDLGMLAEVQLRLRVRKEQVGQWEEAARLNSSNLVDWISSSLDKASDAVIYHAQ